jgi:hypothetical protein
MSVLVCFVAGPREIEARYVEIPIVPSAVSPARTP